MGTRIENLQVVKVTDGDTLTVEFNGHTEKLRLMCVDTEESIQGSHDKPVTKAGKMAAKMAKKYFRDGNELCKVTIEFDSDDPLNVCMKKFRGNYGRLLCYVFRGDENYNLKLVREGWSPYFMKYGRSHLYHREFVDAETIAMAQNLMIWNSETNAGGPSRDYQRLIPWWETRAQVVDDFRYHPLHDNLLSLRYDYDRILEAARRNEEVVLFFDFKSGITRWTSDVALIYSGSHNHRFKLVITDLEERSAQEIIQLLNNRYTGMNKGYAFVSGRAEFFDDTPQIILKSIDQISDFPDMRRVGIPEEIIEKEHEEHH